MGKRFSRLDYALKALKKPDGTGTEAALPDGSILGTYQKVKSGETVLKYPRANDDSNPGQILQVSVLPFFFAGADGSETIVPFSKRVKEEDSVGTIVAASNHVITDIETHQEVKGFFPAQAVVTKIKATPDNKTSKVTGIPYKQFNDGSYTIPYGASSAEKAEGQVRKGILTAIAALDNTLVSFSSEKV